MLTKRWDKRWGGGGRARMARERGGGTETVRASRIAGSCQVLRRHRGVALLCDVAKGQKLQPLTRFLPFSFVVLNGLLKQEKLPGRRPSAWSKCCWGYEELQLTVPLLYDLLGRWHQRFPDRACYLAGLLQLFLHTHSPPC